MKNYTIKLIIFLFILTIIQINPLWCGENPNVIRLDTNNLFEALDKVNKLKETKKEEEKALQPDKGEK